MLDEIDDDNAGSVWSCPFAGRRGSSLQDWLYKLYRVLYFLWCSCAHRIVGGQVPPEPTSFVNSARGVRQFGFLGAFTRLPTSTTATSFDSLQRLRCYDDDVADPSSSSTATTGYLSLSPLFIYLFLFLPVLQYACLDVLQSSFKYACLEHVTFKLSICVYVIIMSNNFWIIIMRKLSIFLTVSGRQLLQDDHVRKHC
jgi:hypothetical protein